MGILQPRDDTRYIPFVKFEKDIINHVANYYLEALKQVNIKMPIAICITLVDVKDYYVSRNPKHPRDKIKDRTLRLPVVVLDSWDTDICKVLKNSFDYLWNNCGFEGSLNYDEQGNWNEYRGWGF